MRNFYFQLSSIFKLKNVFIKLFLIFTSVILINIHLFLIIMRKYLSVPLDVFAMVIIEDSKIEDEKLFFF